MKKTELIVSIKTNGSYARYEKTKSKLRYMRIISEHDFNNTPQYKMVLVKQLDETIRHLNELRDKVKK